MSVNPLWGTWALKSYVVMTDRGEKFTPYGEHPRGNLSYSSDGRMQVMGTASGRIAPLDATPTDQEQAALHSTMFAYAGTYSRLLRNSSVGPMLELLATSE